jgi:hypothetical protein
VPSLRPAPRLLVVVLVVLIAFVVGGCSRVSSPRSWIASAQLADGGTVTVTVRDESGRIDGAEVDPSGVTTADAVSNPAGKPGVLLVSWVGGACDVDTDIQIGGTAEALTVAITRSASDGECDTIGIGHVLRLTSAKPLPADTVTVRTSTAAAS